MSVLIKEIMETVKTKIHIAPRMRKETKKQLDILPDEDTLSKHIETLTNSGLKDLDKNIMSQIKRICKKSNKNITTAYGVIMRELKRKHAEVRYSSFQICIELFAKSHEFRRLLVNDLETICELTIGINPQIMMPPPREVFENLKKLALTTLQQWSVTYGVLYKQLMVCCQYLTHSKGINFTEIQREADKARRLEELRLRQLQARRDERMRKFREEFDEIAPAMKNAIGIVTNCIGLLLPTPDDFFLPADGETDNVDIFSTNLQTSQENFEPRQFGLSHSYNLTITINTDKIISIKRTQDNGAVIDNLKDALKMLRQYLPRAKKWVAVFSSDGVGQTESVSVSNILKEVDDCLNKCKTIKIEGIDVEESDSEDDDGFVEVKKDGFEDSVAINLLYGPSTSKGDFVDIANKIPVVENVVMDKGNCKPSIKSAPVTEESMDSETSVETKPSTTNTAISGSSLGTTRITSDPAIRDSRKERLLAIAPKLPYDVDLYHWEDEKLTLPTLQSSTLDTCTFWGSGSHVEHGEIPDPRGIEALRSRTIEFTGDFEPVKWTCRVPLLSGKLCPRRDRIKCPFHGKIVPRDNKGKRVEVEGEVEKQISTTNDTSPEEEAAVPDWQDPQLLAELKAATGIDLTMPCKRKKKNKQKEEKVCKKKRRKGEPRSDVLEVIKKRNFPGLKDMSKSGTKTRLRKKLFNKASMKRISDDLERQRRRRYNDKFGDQFNYT